MLKLKATKELERLLNAADCIKNTIPILNDLYSRQFDSFKKGCSTSSFILQIESTSRAMRLLEINVRNDFNEIVAAIVAIGKEENPRLLEFITEEENNT